MKKAGRRKYSFSDRLTGSHIIDEEIQTILYYVFRDYIHPWYVLCIALALPQIYIVHIER